MSDEIFHMPVCARSIKFCFPISVNGVDIKLYNIIQLDGYIKLLKFYYFFPFFSFLNELFLAFISSAVSCSVMSTDDHWVHSL